jgi:hypothetical protein
MAQLTLSCHELEMQGLLKESKQKLKKTIRTLSGESF